MAWSVLVVSGLLLSPILLFGIPHLNQAFWVGVFARLILDSIAFTLFIKALQLSPLSLTTPMLSLQQVFLIFTQILINHLFPTLLGVIGVLITIFGVYYLNFDHDTKHILSPFKAIWKEKGVRIIILVAVLWSLVVTFQKMSIDNSNPLFYTAFFQLLWAICFTPVAFFADRKGFKKLFQPKLAKHVVPAGIFDAIQILPQYIAYSLTLPLYVNVVSQVNILFSSFFGWLFYKEKVQKHIVPTIIIIIGIVILSFGQK